MCICQNVHAQIVTPKSRVYVDDSLGFGVFIGAQVFSWVRGFPAGAWDLSGAPVQAGLPSGVAVGLGSGPPCPSRHSEPLLKTPVRGRFAVHALGLSASWMAAFWSVLSTSDLDFHRATPGLSTFSQSPPLPTSDKDRPRDVLSASLLC